MNDSRTLLSVLLCAAALAAGCGNVEAGGDYDINVTNGENGCMLSGWTVGDSASGVDVAVMQSEDQVQLDVQGVTGVQLDLLVGSSIFNGQVSGSSIQAALIGSNSARQGECSYTYTVDLDATLDGDFLEGELVWRPVTNGHPDCGVLETCRNRQTFNGTRPPSP